MYGRRRVGKTTLLSEFCKDKNSLFFVAEEYNDKIALEKFSRSIFEKWGNNVEDASFGSWESAFNYIGEKAKKEKIVLILDEFQYIANTNRSILSLLQNMIDHKLKDTKLFLVICGSLISFIEKKVLSSKSPLFGRKTAEFYIKPMGFFESREFFSKYSFTQQIEAYSILGGIPLYLLKFDNEYSIEENIKENFLSDVEFLYTEPKSLLKQELRNPTVYNSIVEAIAQGYSRINEIATKIGEEKDKVVHYLATLLDMHIVEKVIPVTEKANTKKTFYRINDNLFNFWYRFIFGNITNIERGMSDIVYQNKIKPFINEYTSKIFEDICKEYLIKQNISGKTPFLFDRIGKWWGNNKIIQREEEVDIVAIAKDNILFAECKYRNQKTDVKVIEELIKKSEIFEHKNKYFYIFSKSGYTRRTIEKAKENKNIYLIDNEIMSKS